MSAPLIAVTGATGRLGRLVVEALLEREVPAHRIVAAVRNPETAAALAARGVEVRRADYAQPDTLDAAFAGVTKLLLISSRETGHRLQQHENVVQAARKAKVALLAYTSILKADTALMQLAIEHRETERFIRDSGLPFVFLRNGWYIENYTDHLAQMLEEGVIVESAGDGRVSAATREDYAAAAATVLTGEGHEQRVYELGGDEAFTLTEFAAEVSKQSGQRVVYRDLSGESYAEAVARAGLPESFARALAASEPGIRRGELFTDSGDLSRLIGRPTTTLAGAVAAALEKLHHRSQVINNIGRAG